MSFTCKGKDCKPDIETENPQHDAWTEAERRWAEHPRTIKTIALMKQDAAALHPVGKEVAKAMMVPEHLL